MNVVPLSGRGTAAVRDALLSHGWEGDVASLTAGGLEVAGFHVTGLAGDAVEAMVPLAARLGLELVTGEDWLLLVGPRARLGAFARPWVQPEPVRELAMAIGVAMPGEGPAGWRHARGVIPLDHPVIVGVVNVTPDSFSEPSRVLAPDEALRLVDALREGGATVVDVGGESTRPGATPVPEEVERERILPVLAAIASRHPELPLSVDTVHGATARAALAAGAAIVNDVTAGRHDPSLLEAAAAAGAGVVLSHSRGTLGTLASYQHAEYQGDVTAGVVRELAAARQAARDAGAGDDTIVLDPGFGFAKTPAQSWRLLRQLDALVAVGQPVLVGVSRKRFLADATGRAVEDRDRATAAACALAHERGARLFRVHDPAAVRDALAVADALGR